VSLEGGARAFFGAGFIENGRATYEGGKRLQSKGEVEVRVPREWVEVNEFCTKFPQKRKNFAHWQVMSGEQGDSLAEKRIIPAESGQLLRRPHKKGIPSGSMLLKRATEAHRSAL
jgi:hypothetical protein